MNHVDLKQLGTCLARRHAHNRSIKERHEKEQTTRNWACVSTAFAVVLALLALVV